MSKAINVHIRGHVQGVFYRSKARELAQDLELRGWIKNEIDGSVRAHLQGDPQTIDKWLQWAQSGPELANVSQIETSEADFEKLSSFEIRYR